MNRGTIKVWDPLIRVFHWSLVTSYAIAWLTAEDLAKVHEWAGYVVGGLLVFRILWGLVGPKYARFGQFVHSPATVVEYFRAMIKGKEQRYLGHNPAGGLMIIALMLALAGAVLTGWMSTLDAYRGVEWIEGAHALLANLTLLMVIAHVGGVILASFRHKENLARAMVVGHKRAPEPADIV
jgi:cytochrome b